MSKEEKKAANIITENEEIKKVLEREEKEKEALTDKVKKEYLDRAEEQTEEQAELELTKAETVAFNRLMNNYNAYDVEKTLLNCFEGIFRNTKYYVEATTEYATEMQTFLKDAKIYSAEYIGSKQKDINSAFNSKINTYGDLVLNRLADIKVNLFAKAQQLPLGSAEFNTAFNLIDTAGKNISENTLKQIAEQFRGDLASLNALKSTAAAFGSVGVKYFDDLIFDPIQTVGKLQLQAMELFNNYPTMPGLTSLGEADAMPKDVGNLKYKAILFGKRLEELAELANITVMPWYTEIVKAEEADEIAFFAGLNSAVYGGVNDLITES